MRPPSVKLFLAIFAELLLVTTGIAPYEVLPGRAQLCTTAALRILLSRHIHTDVDDIRQFLTVGKILLQGSDHVAHQFGFAHVLLLPHT